MAQTTHRRVKGDGTVYRDAASGKWIGQLDLGRDAVTGNRQRRKVTGDTRTEVNKRLRELAKEHEAGKPVAKATDTVGKLLADYFEKGLPPTTQSAKTVDGYRVAIEKHLVPALGHIRLAELTPDHVDNLLRAKSREI